MGNEIKWDEIFPNGFSVFLEPDVELPSISVVGTEPWGVVSPGGFEIEIVANEDSGIVKYLIYVIVEHDGDGDGYPDQVVSGESAEPDPDEENVWRFAVTQGHLDSGSASPGEWVWLAVDGKDAEGNEIEWEVLTPDGIAVFLEGNETDPPEVNITSHDENTDPVSYEGFELSGTASDLSGIRNVHVNVIDSRTGEVTAEWEVAEYDSIDESWNFSILPEHFTPGNDINVSVIARDKQTNYSSAANVTLSVEEFPTPFGVTPHKNVAGDTKWEDIKDVGIEWLRLQANIGDWCGTDEGVGGLINVSIGGHEFKDYLTLSAGSTLPEGNPLNIYINFVECVVQTYGTNSPYGIEYFQVQNEPNHLDHWDRGDVIDPVGDYAKLLQITYDAVQEFNEEFDPEVKAKVILGGVASGGAEGPSIDADFYCKLFENGIYTDAPNARVEDYFDIVDLHLYGNHENMMSDKRAFVDMMGESMTHKVLSDVPIWVSEYGINSKVIGTTSLDGTEQTQAEHVIKGTIRSLANGISKLFWISNIDKVACDESSPFCDMGLMVNDATPKLSYYSYRKMTDKYNEISTQKIVPHYEQAGGIYLYELRGKDVSYWLAWEDNDLHSTIDIVIDGTAATVVESVPEFNSGLQVKIIYGGYAGAFTEETVEVNDSTISLTLSRTPVFISVSP